MKKTVGLILFVLLTGIVLAFTFSNFKEQEEIQTLSNTSELYSLFSPYMEAIILSRLNPISCIPNEYYYNDSSICFFCNEIVPCFSYGWVDRSGGERMNPKGSIYLSGHSKLESEINFYTFGMFNLLSCECNGECVCEDGIKINKSIDFEFIIPDNINVSEKIQDIAKRKGIENCKVPQNNTQFYYCEELSVFVSNNEVVFWWEEKY